MWLPPRLDSEWLLRIFTAAKGSLNSIRHFFSLWVKEKKDFAFGWTTRAPIPIAWIARRKLALLIEIGPWMDDFIARLFGIEKEVAALAERHHQLAPLYTCKRLFVQRRAMNKVSEAEVAQVDGVALEQKLAAELDAPFSELAFARKVTEWLLDEAGNEERLKDALLYAAWALKTPPAGSGIGMVYCSRRRQNSISCIFCRPTPTTAPVIPFTVFIIYGGGRDSPSLIRARIW